MLEALAPAVLAFDAAQLAAEASLRRPRPAPCRYAVVVPARRPRDLAKFRGYAQYAVVDDEVDAEAARRAGLTPILNRYGGKSGALATALEEVEADLYIFLDDDVEPGPWVEELAWASGCRRFATAYRWVEDRLQNAFSLGGMDWMALRPLRFLYGGAMAVPASARERAVKALLSCPADDMALTRVAHEIAVIPRLVRADPAPGTWSFMVRQAAMPRMANLRLWLAELAYYLLWTAAALSWPWGLLLLALHAARTAMRSIRAGGLDPLQVLMSPLERPLQAAVFLASAFKRCVELRGSRICGRC